MSLKVLVIPEDATKDHYILKPVISAMLAVAGKPRAAVSVLTDPAVKGVQQALDDGFLVEVFERYPMVDLFLICVDRDGQPGRDVSVADRQAAAQEKVRDGVKVWGTAAHQEVEVWCLAGMNDLPKEWKWQEVRSDASAKENYFEPYVALRNLQKSAGEGREILGREAAGNIKAIVSRCEEVKDLMGSMKEL